MQPPAFHAILGEACRLMNDSERKYQDLPALTREFIEQTLRLKRRQLVHIQ